MTTLDGSIDINTPDTVAYEHWTRIERFPFFAEFVETVKPIDAQRSHWRVNLGGWHEDWEAEIVEVISGKRIAWRSLKGSVNSGVVTFHSTGRDTCVAVLHLEYDPHGIIESLGDELGVVQRLMGRFLDQFKDFTESMY